MDGRHSWVLILTIVVACTVGTGCDEMTKPKSVDWRKGEIAVNADGRLKNRVIVAAVRRTGAKGGMNFAAAQRRAIDLQPAVPARRRRTTITKGVGKGFRRKPTVRGGAPLPAGAVGAALAAGRALAGSLRGSPITGATRGALISKAAAGPITGLKLANKKPARQRRAGSVTIR